MNKWTVFFLLLIAGFIALYLAFGKPGFKKRDYIIPKLTDLPLNEAKKRIEETEALVIGEVVYEYSSDRTHGTVIGQKPAPGDRYAPGDKIIIYVAGPVVPDVVGLSEKEARGTIKDLGLPLGETVRRASEKVLGTVIDQQPKGGVPLQKGQRIILYIAFPRMLPELTEKVRQKVKGAVRNDFALRGKLAYQISSKEEDTGRIYICELTYSIFVFSNGKLVNGPVRGGLKKWAYDSDRAKEFVFNALVETVAPYAAAAIHPENDRVSTLPNLNENTIYS